MSRYCWSDEETIAVDCATSHLVLTSTRTTRHIARELRATAEMLTAEPIFKVFVCFWIFGALMGIGLGITRDGDDFSIPLSTSTPTLAFAVYFNISHVKSSQLTTVTM
ncbi:hypothetical protein BDQ17DRAFT_1326700 [Cyathus striatus]|nr:hypothetical protein BDQ17DRAFT_1326700 [Cyathus striatus]